MSDKNERDGGDDLPFEDPILVDQRRQMFARQYPLPEEEEQHNEHWQKLHTLHLAQQRQTELAVQSMQNDLTQIKEHLEDRYASIKEKIIGEEHERQWTILTKKYSETEAAAIAEALGVRPKSREMEKKEREEKEKREQEKEAAMAILRQPAVANALQMIQEQEPRAGPSNSSTWRGGRGRGTWRRGGHQFRPY